MRKKITPKKKYQGIHNINNKQNVNDMMNLPWCRIWSLNNLSEFNFLEQYSQIKILSGSVSNEKENCKINF